MAQKQHVYATLDGLRGIGAISIVLMHLHHGISQAYSPAGAYLAVDLFFGLSGFVLAGAYGRRFDSGLDLVSFMRKRILRLWPLYALGILISGLPAIAHGLHHSQALSVSAAMLAQLVYLPWPDAEGHLYPLNIPAWSLLFELVANALLAMTWRWLSLRTLLGVAVVSAVVLAAAAARHGTMDIGSRTSDVLGALARVVCSFTLGILVWRLRPSRPLGRAWVAAGLLVGALALPSGPAPRWVLDVTLTLVAFPGVLWLAAGSEPTVGLPLFKAAGAMSYALYAVHVPILRETLRPLMVCRPPSCPAWALATLLVFALIGLAWLLNEADVRGRRLFDSAAGTGRQPSLST